MHPVLAVLLAGLLFACAETRPDTVVSPRLDSGVSSSNGGGARALDGQPGGLGITTRVSPAR